METSKIEIELDLKNLDLFKNLVSLLEMHFEDLPKELQESLEDITDFKSEDFEYMFPDAKPELIETSFKTIRITSINKAIKRVKYFEKQ